MGKIKSDYSCSLTLFNDLLGGKWKLRILWHIIAGDNRFSRLQRAIPDISHKMLITQLKELEASGLIKRYDYGGYPMRVEYALTTEYSTIIHILNQLCNFAEDYAVSNHISVSISQSNLPTEISSEYSSFNEE